MLSDADVERYSRQILLPEVGGRGQERLGAAGIAVSVAEESGTLREAALLGALHLAVAGVGRIAPLGPRAAMLAGDLELLVRERNPAVEIAARGPIDLVVGFGIVPETSLASLAALASGSRVGILSTAGGAACVSCRAALEAALGAPKDPPAAIGPFLAGIVATGALARLLDLPGPVALAFDVARAAPLDATAPCHECPARTRS